LVRLVMHGRHRLEDACRGVGWLQSRTLRCLGFDWSILTNDPALVDRITYLYEPCLVGQQDGPRHVFILRSHTSSETPSVSLYRDGRAIVRRAPAGLAIARVVWEVNRGVVEEAQNQLLLHAAAAERDGRVVLLAGPEGSGKSTLVAALVRSGLRYVTDETVAVELPGVTIAPYPKPIALDRGSLESLGDLSAAVPSTLATGLEQRLVPAQAIRPDAVASAGGVASLLVLPAYRPGRPTSAQSISRADAAIVLAEQAFNFRALGPGRVEAIAELVRSCKCYRLDVGDLDAASRIVLELFDCAVAVQ
jgi:HprK-related kinase A